MKSRKIIIFMLIMILVCVNISFISVSANNAITISANIVGNDVTVTIATMSTDNSRYSVTILQPDKTETDSFDDVNVKISNVYRIGQVSGSKNITYKFSMTDNDAYGKYTVVVGGKNLDSSSKKVAYFVKVDPEKASNAITALNDSSLSADSLENILKTNNSSLWILDIDGNEFKQNKQRFLSVMLSVKDSAGYKTTADVVQKFELTSDLIDLYNSTSGNLSNYLTLYSQILNCNIPQKFLDGVQEYAEAYCNLKSDETNYPFYNFTDFKTILNDAVPLAELNMASRTEIESILTQYNDRFKLNLNGDYTKVSSYEVEKAMADQTFTSYNQVSTFFYETINNLLKQQGSSSGNNSSNSKHNSGSSSKSSGVVTVKTITKEDVENVKENKQLTYEDVPKEYWAEPYIEYLTYNDIMKGDGNNFRPDDKITREEFVSLLMKVMKYDPVATASANFKDVQTDAWYFSALNLAVTNKVCNGMDNDFFGIGKTITRQDAVTMIERAINAKKVVLNKKNIKMNFADSKEFADYSKDAISDICEIGIINGYEDNTFRPDNEMLRVEAAKIIYSLIDNMYGIENGGLK